MRLAVTSIVDLERTAHNRLHQLLRVLVDRHEITVFSIQDWWKDKQVGESVYRSGFEDLLERVKLIPFTGRRISPVAQEVVASTRAAKLLRIDRTDFDAHLDYNTLMSGAAFGSIFRRRGVPTVYDLADDLVAMVKNSPQIPAPLRGVAGAVAAGALRRNLRGASRVTVINDVLAREAGVDPTKLRRLPNGVDTRMFTPLKSELRSKLGLESALVLGYVGVLREWVNFQPVLEAMASLRVKTSLPPLRLLIVGEEGGRDRIVQHAQRLGVLDQVVFAGTVPYPEVPAYIAAMDACLIPFDSSKISANSLPLKLFEYAACEKPVIASPIAGIRDCAQDRIFYAADRESYLQVIRRIADGGLESDLVRNSAWVRENYSWQGVGHQLEAIISEAVRGP